MEDAAVRGSEEDGVRYDSPCREWFHIKCVSLPKEDLSEARVDFALHPWNCIRCLVLSSSIQELLKTMKLLSERVQELESANDDMSARLELPESHDLKAH